LGPPQNGNHDTKRGGIPSVTTLLGRCRKRPGNRVKALKQQKIRYSGNGGKEEGMGKTKNGVGQ